MITALAAILLALAADTGPTPEQVFEKRIAPIFKSPNPSSCVQCHLSGVDLKDYIRPSSRETFLSLRDQGLIDLEAPEKSRILALIDMGKEDKGAALIHEKNRTAEYDAFVAWLVACSSDKELCAAPKLKPEEFAMPKRPVEVIRHARKDRLLESFENTVWAMRFRCAGCHTPAAIAEHLKKKPDRKFGPNMAWLQNSASDSLLLLMKSGLLDTKEPEKSLLLLKPLNEVEHGGGVKFLSGDGGYKAFRTFLEDYAKTVNDQYPSAAELPKRPTVEAFGTDIWLKIGNTPAEWADKLVIVKLFAWDAEKKSWEPEPIAITDRKVWGKGKLWQHTLTLLAPVGSDRAKAWRAKAALSQGKYLVRAYLDGNEQLAKDWKTELDIQDFVGEMEVFSAWPTGYGKMTVLDAGNVRKP